MNPSSPSSGRAGKFAALGAGVLLAAAVVTIGVVTTTSAPSDPVDAAAESGAHARPIATPEQAYALSLPALDAWLDDDFANSWIVASTTLAQVGAALDLAAFDDEAYAIWVPRYESVVAVADAIVAHDEAAARTAFDPLLEEEPGPYVDAAIDHALAADPFADADAALGRLDAAIAAEDRTDARQAAAATAGALAQVARAAQLTLPPPTAPQALAEMLPALHAIDDIHDAVLDGHASDAATAAAALHTAFDGFRSWYATNTNEER